MTWPRPTSVAGEGSVLSVWPPSAGQQSTDSSGQQIRLGTGSGDGPQNDCYVGTGRSYKQRSSAAASAAVASSSHPEPASGCLRPHRPAVRAKDLYSAPGRARRGSRVQILRARGSGWEQGSVVALRMTAGGEWPELNQGRISSPAIVRALASSRDARASGPRSPLPGRS
jgi:hypothetical protein